MIITYKKLEALPSPRQNRKMKASNTSINTPRTFSIASIFFALLTFLTASVETALAAGPGSAGNYFGERAAKREASRWTLEEWLIQKDRNAMMDLWLAFNQSSPYELSASISNKSYQNKTDNGAGSITDQAYYDYTSQLSAYATIFGLSFEYENNTPERWNETTGIFNLRVLGSSIQNTNLTLMYGLRTRNFDQYSPSVRLGQSFAGAELQIYLAKYFGLSGQYRSFMPTTDSTWTQEIEIRKNTNTLIETNIDRTGIRSGLKLFF
jgi:hypothetical protein